MEALYKRLYFFLFNRISDAVKAFNAKSGEEALRILIASQQECEEMFMETAEDE